jgi:XTP/dITP diphosphohydrolase
VTFVENALAKARHAARETGLPALADDSGLCVPRSAAPGRAVGALCRRAEVGHRATTRN